MKTTLRCLNRVIFLAIVGSIAACGGDDSSTGGTGGTGGSAGAGGSGGGGGGDSGSADSGETKIATSTGTWNVYPDPYADGGANPVPMTVKGTAEAFSSGSKMRVKLTVSGLPNNRPFGSHIHKLACEDTKAGGHYQNMPAPDGGATDPNFANSKNEVWLDFVTNAMGEGSAEATVDWIPRAGEAKSVMLHDTMTMMGGTAGAKLACTNMAF